MKNKHKSTVILLIVTLLLFSLAGLYLYKVRNSSNAPKGYVKLKSYDHIDGMAEAGCQAANAPECGYCPGQLTDKSCYVKKTEKDRWE